MGSSPGGYENHNIKVLVSDNQGGELLVPFTVKITQEKRTTKFKKKQSNREKTIPNKPE